VRGVVVTVAIAGPDFGDLLRVGGWHRNRVLAAYRKSPGVLGQNWGESSERHHRHFGPAGESGRRWPYAGSVGGASCVVVEMAKRPGCSRVHSLAVWSVFGNHHGVGEQSDKAQHAGTGPLTDVALGDGETGDRCVARQEPNLLRTYLPSE
jgi:hypothetical protein